MKPLTISSKVIGIGLLLLLVAFVLGRVTGGRRAESDHQEHAEESSKPAKAQLWTCAMHPQIQLPKPGKCPICGMNLIPLETSDEEVGSMRELSVSEHAKKLMEIETAPVERKFVTAEVRMVGKVDYDETRFIYITAWVPGRLDRLFVDYTGVEVKKGHHMVSIYSPELLTAQEELLQALKLDKEVGASEVSTIRKTARQTVDAVKEKLRLWGVTPDQIAEIEKRGTPSDHMTIYSPSSGIVVHKNAQEGMYVKTGTKIYTISDLSQVWVRLDAYESDLMWIRYGQQVEFTTESYPGETFTGTIAFIDPILTQSTRTVKVRVNVPNADAKLKPGMFVRAIVRADVAAAGKVMEPELAGKWICPMHPDVVKDEKGTCDICGMPLVTTESLGYAAVDSGKSEKPLVIPVSAALVTGKRAIVFVEVPGKDKPTFEGREIVLGPRAGDYYLVRHGLKQGERVVTKGNFKMDAELQIHAKPSMMTPEAGGGRGDASDLKLPAITRSQIYSVISAASNVEKAVDTDDLNKIRAAFSDLAQKVEAVDGEKIQGHAKMLWKEHAMLLGNAGVVGQTVENMSEAKQTAELLKERLTSMKSAFGITREHKAEARSAMDPAFHKQFNKVVENYLAIGHALAKDSAEEAIGAVKNTSAALAKVDMKLLTGDDHMAWMKHEAELKKILSRTGKSKKIEAIRKNFAPLSEEMMTTLQRLGTSGAALYQFKCPMAFDNKGATWLQNDEGTRNPYFGSAMLKCGEVIEVIKGK